MRISLPYEKEPTATANAEFEYDLRDDGEDHRPLALANRGSIIFTVTSLNREETQVFTMALDR